MAKKSTIVTIGLVLLLLMSGCVGGTDTPTQTTPSPATSAEDSSATSTAAQNNSTDTQAQNGSTDTQDDSSDTQADFSSQTWVTDTGIDSELLVETHRNQLANSESFTINETVWLNENFASGGDNDTGYFRAEWDFETPQASIDQISSSTYITSDTRYRRDKNDEQGEYRTNPEERSQSEFRSLARSTAFTTLEGLGGPGVPVVERLASVNWTYQDTLKQNGTTLYRLTGSKQNNSVNMSAEMLVDTNGVIHRFWHHQQDKRRLTESGISVRVWNVNSTTVTAPEWIENAD